MSESEINKLLADLQLSPASFAEEFSIDQTTTEKYRSKAKIFLKNCDIRPSAITKKTMLTIANALEINLPKKDEQFRIRTQTQLSMLAIVLSVLRKHDLIDELTIATYTLNREAYNLLTALLGKRISKINLFLASSYTFRDAKYYDFLKKDAKRLMLDFDYHLVFAWSHLKITLIRCGDDFYQLEGSMNYSQNNLAENLVFENCRESYEYDYEFVLETMTKTTHKALEIIC